MIVVFEQIFKPLNIYLKSKIMAIEEQLKLFALITFSIQNQYNKELTWLESN